MFQALWQDWAFLVGDGTTPFPQGSADWLDVGPYGDAMFWLEVRSVSNPGAGDVKLAYETSPAADDALFRSLAEITLTASSTPVITKIALGGNPEVPLARWLRWKLVGTASGAWSVTLRIHVLARKGSSSGFDAATLSLTGFWRASYAASPWVGVPSAGSSGSRDLSEATNPPSAGAAINGLTPADFDGTNDVLTNATQMGTLLSASAWSCWALVNIDAINTNNTDVWLNDPIFNDSGAFWGIHLKSGGTVHAYQWDGAAKSVSETIATGAWALVQAKYDGTNLRLRVNGGSWQSVAAGNIATTTGTLRVGLTPTAGHAFDGRMADLGIANTAFSDATFDDLKSYINARYGLSL